jgi:hypothetical protein
MNQIKSATGNRSMPVYKKLVESRRQYSSGKSRRKLRKLIIYISITVILKFRIYLDIRIYFRIFPNHFWWQFKTSETSFFKRMKYTIKLNCSFPRKKKTKVFFVSGDILYLQWTMPFNLLLIVCYLIWLHTCMCGSPCWNLIDEGRKQVETNTCTKHDVSSGWKTSCSPGFPTGTSSCRNWD